MGRLDELSEGFRDGFLDQDALTAQVCAWAEGFPDLVRVTSLGTSPQGRDLWLLTLGPEPDRVRPALWVDGNMHAGELAGSSAALAVAEDVLRVHLGESLHGLGSDAVDTVRECLVYVAPRLSPDGAETVLKTGRTVRSVPRDQRAERTGPRWVTGDVDGDGLVQMLRMEDPAGEFVESTAFPGLMVPRELGDSGPFWRVWPEGHIEGFDGHHVPSPVYLSDNAPDLNRNFPWFWVPEHEQAGAGRYPGSEPESRAVMDFATRSRHLFAWVDFHTFGGVFIRPCGDKPDNEMDRDDLALYRQLGKWAEDLTGYPMVSGFEEFTYAPNKPIHGDLAEWAYAHLGCVSYVCELWDLFARMGIDRPKRFVDYYDRVDRAALEALATWDRDHNHGRVVVGWRAFDHPQLGPVEIGGLDVREGLWNPPREVLPEMCAQQAAMALRLAALAPRLRAKAHVEPIGDARRVVLVVDNLGYLPTQVLSSAKQLSFNEPLYATFEGDGCEVEPASARQEVGHLDGWGRGLNAGFGALYHQRSRGTTSSRRLEAVVRGEGTVRVRVGSCRMGWIELSAS